MKRFKRFDRTIREVQMREDKLQQPKHLKRKNTSFSIENSQEK